MKTLASVLHPASFFGKPRQDGILIRRSELEGNSIAAAADWTSHGVCHQCKKKDKQTTDRFDATLQDINDDGATALLRELSVSTDLEGLRRRTKRGNANRNRS